jgi:site-specific DNA-methyltransferase (adenine-specific)
MAKMPENSVDMVMTSPPYDGLRTYNGYSFDFEPIARQLFRVVKDGGVVVWNVADATVKGSETGTSFRQALYFMECGFNLHDTMLYHKINYAPLTHNRYEQAFEYMFVLSKGKPKTFNGLREEKRTNAKPGRFFQKADSATTSAANSTSSISADKLRSNIWSYTVGGGKTGHPAVFPLQMATDHILSWSNEGDIVFDPFTGSGTTGVACVNTDRQFIGTEMSKEYFEISRNRLELPVHLLDDFGFDLEAA